MSREIKFRTWRKDLNKMVVADQLILRLPVYAMSDDGNIVLMQFTGLKDRGGKEIYEGDIVFPQEYHKKFIVKWCNGKGENLGNQVGWSLDDGYYQLDFTAYLHWSENEREEYANVDVLGNIYEHPDLLKGVGSFGYDPLTGETKG